MIGKSGGVLLLLSLLASQAWCATIVSEGELHAPPNARIMVVSTDFVIQRVLSEDAAAYSRQSTSISTNTYTITVTSSERTMAPGISLQQIAPGDAEEVAALLKKAGIKLPSLGDTGDANVDPYEAAAFAAQNYGPTTASQQAFSNFSQYMGPYGPMGSMMGGAMGGMPGMIGPAGPLAGAPAYGSSPAAGGWNPSGKARNSGPKVYPTLLLVRAEGKPGNARQTFLAVIAPDENVDAVRKDIAERIADSVLK